MSCGMKTPLANCLHQTSSILKQSLCFAPPLLLLLGFIFYASLNFSCYLTFSIPLSFSLGGLALSQSLLQTQLFRLIVFLCLLLAPVLKRFSSFLFFFYFLMGEGGWGLWEFLQGALWQQLLKHFHHAPRSAATVWRTVRLYNFNNFVMSLSIKVSLVFCG